MQVKLLGKIWRLEFSHRVGSRGTCDSPDTKEKKILIHQDLQGEELLEVLLHEMLHASNWWMDEEFVEDAAKDLSHALWRLGYRREDDSE